MTSRLLRSFGRGALPATPPSSAAPAPAPSAAPHQRGAAASTGSSTSTTASITTEASGEVSAVARLAPAIAGAVRGSAAQVEAVTQLRHLFRARASPAEFARIADDIVAEGLLALLVVLLRESATAFEAAWVILNVSSIKSGAHAAVRAGALPALVALLRPHAVDDVQEDVCEQACWCLANIAGDGAPLRDAVLATPGAVDAVARALHPATVRWRRAGAATAGRSRWETASWLLVNLVRSSPAPSLAVIRPLIGALGSALPSAAAHREEEALSHLCWASSYIVSATAASNEARVLAFVDFDLLRPALELLGGSVSRRKCIYPLLRAVTAIVVQADRVALKMLIRKALEHGVVANLIALLPSSADRRVQLPSSTSTVAGGAPSTQPPRAARHDELASAALLVLDMFVAGCGDGDRDGTLTSAVAATLVAADAIAKLGMQQSSVEFSVRTTASKILRWVELHHRVSVDALLHTRRRPASARARVTTQRRGAPLPPLLSLPPAQRVAESARASARRAVLDDVTSATTASVFAPIRAQTQAELIAYANRARDTAAGGDETKTATAEATMMCTEEKTSGAAPGPVAPSKPPPEFFCPITREVMEVPVVLVGDGHTYERSAIVRWLTIRATSPMTNESLAMVPPPPEAPAPHHERGARLSAALRIITQGRLHQRADAAPTALAVHRVRAPAVNIATMLVPNHSLRKLIASWTARAGSP